MRIQRVFTAIRNALNEREDELLSEVDTSLNDLFFDEEYVKKGEKLPNKINKSLQKGKETNKDWNNNISLSINNCITIENNLKDIKNLNEKIDKSIEKKNVEVKFSPTNEYRLYYILDVIKNFGQIFKNNYKYSFITITNLEIPKVDPIKSSIKNSLNNVQFKPTVANQQRVNQQFQPFVAKPPQLYQQVQPPPQIQPYQEVPQPLAQPYGEMQKFQSIKPNFNINNNIIDQKVEKNDIKNKYKEINYNKPFGDKSPLIGLNLDKTRKYTISGKKENIITKDGKDNTWMGGICQIEFENPKEYIWAIKILKT